MALTMEQLCGLDSELERRSVGNLQQAIVKGQNRQQEVNFTYEIVLGAKESWGNDERGNNREVPCSSPSSSYVVREALKTLAANDTRGPSVPCPTARTIQPNTRGKGFVQKGPGLRCWK